MKSLKHYITESVKSYNYTIKIAGEVDKNFIDMFKYNLNKFDPIKISDPVTTPIQKDPYGFPNLSNQSITIIKADFRYPATEPMIQQIAQLLGYNVNMVRVITSDFNDSINNEADGYANEMQHSPVLTHEEMEEQPVPKKLIKLTVNHIYLVFKLKLRVQKLIYLMQVIRQRIRLIHSSHTWMTLN